MTGHRLTTTSSVGKIMRSARSTLIGTAVAVALFGPEAVVRAQTSGDQTSSNQTLQEVVVTGIRASLEKSLEQKRAADSVEEVITSEDVGKMPDKNIADSLKRVAGVTISSAGATEGGFDENDRVSLRVAGSVDVITRRPLDFKKPFTFEGSAGAVYADLPSKTDPQLSALVNWRNDESNFGVLLQGFYEKRHLRRDGVELLGYDTIGSNS